MLKIESVAILEPVGGHGGMDYSDYGLADGLTVAGVDVVLHTCDETAIPDDIAFGVRHTFRGIYGKDAAWKRGLRYMRGSLSALLSAVREERRIIHVHFFYVGILQMMQMIIARLLLRKVVITAHDVESFKVGLEVPTISRFVYRLGHRVITHNQFSKKELIERLGLSPEVIEVIPLGNYLHAVRPLRSQTESRAMLDIPEGSNVLLFFGQIKEVKGLDILLEAMPAVLKQHPDTVLLIAGKPWKTDFSIFEARMERLGIRDRCITHIRHIPDDEVPLYYAASDIVVLPYRRIYQSGVLLMAMSYGKAVLVSDLPGMTEIVKDGENGFVFDCDDKDSLAKRLSSILGNEALLCETALKGLEYVRKNHDWNNIGLKTAFLYKTLI